MHPHTTMICEASNMKLKKTSKQQQQQQQKGKVAAGGECTLTSVSPGGALALGVQRTLISSVLGPPSWPDAGVTLHTLGSQSSASTHL